MNQRRKWLSLCLAIVILLTSAGCGGTTPAETSSAPAASSSSAAASATTEASSAAPTEAPLPKTITMFNGSPLTAPTPAWDTAVGKKIEELTGVKLVVEYLVGQDVMTKSNLMTAAGVYPDLVAAGDNAGIFIGANAFIPLDDLIEAHGTNVKKIYRPNELALSKLQHGKTFILSSNRPSVENLYPAAGYYLNLAVLKDAGYPVVKTIKQYSTLIKDYIKKNPTYNGAPNIGFTLPTEGSRASALQYGGARFLGGYPNDGPTYVDQNTLVAKLNMRGSFTKDYLYFMHDLWNDGYMDKETFMQKDDQYLAKISSGRLLGFYDQRWAISNALGALENAGIPDRTMIAFPVVLDGIQKEYYRGSYAFAVQGVSISTSCKDPEGVFRFLDRLCADDVQKLNYWGIEGVDYTIVDGKFTRTPEQWNNSFNVEYQQTTGISQFNFLPRREGTSDETYAKFEDGNWVNPAMNQEYNDVRYKDYEKDILKSYNIKTFCDFFAPAYPARYEPGWAARQKMPQDSEEFLSVQKCLDIATEYHAKIITAKRADFDKLWAEYQAKLDKVPGIDGYEQAVTKIIQDGAKYYSN